MPFTLDELTAKQHNVIEHLYSGMQVEGIDIETCTSFSRSWLKFMSSKYLDMEWAPAWIVKDVSRRDESKKGHYFIPELFEWHESILDAEMTDEEAASTPPVTKSMMIGDRVVEV